MTSPVTSIDLNADLGESFGRWTLGDDKAMLGVITSANIACGFHAGDPATLLRTCQQAVHADVVIGAQVGYRDLAGFGRRFIDIAPDELMADVLFQIGALDGLARSVGGRVAYVKPHGALYNAVVHDEAQARAVVDAVATYRNCEQTSLPIMGLPGSVVLRIAQGEGLRAVTETFADRAYTPQGTLVPRSQPRAVLHDPEEIAERVVRMATRGRVTANDGTEIGVTAESVCVHGDSPGAVEIATRVRAALTEAGVDLRPFVR
ncbi:UPF0271 protein [Yimella lutea]|uniref:5-oxoprolinase subunit A n=1 Tax=Yimella lutea TaxID=587872 RepID=A0A542ED30_9MICO|nr:5-oxoprolinase subunit PxpA [Yimella lutea]TQJ13237.1 UPF0271 protein [Yimella lutea]